MKLRRFARHLWVEVKRQPKLTLFYGILAVVAFVPIAVLANLLIVYSVNVPWWDQMSFVDLMGELHRGNLTFYDLWSQHNEHRIVVAQAMELAVGQVTGFNFRMPVFLNLLTATGTFTLLVSLLWRTFRNPRTVALLAVPFAWILFTPFQWVNWIWGFQLAFFLCVFFTVLTVWMLTGKDVAARMSVRQPLPYLVILTAAITTYCNGNGMLIWPIGLALLLWQCVGRREIIIWCSSAVFVLASYFYKFHRVGDSPHLVQILKEPVAVFKYVMTYLGRNIATTKTTALYAGLVLFVICVIALVYLYRRHRLGNVAAWIAVAAYVLFTACLAAVSRLNQGVEHSFNSNSYPTLSLQFILATIAIVCYALGVYLKEFKISQLRYYLAVFFVVGSLVALPLPAFFENYFKGVNNFKDLGAHLMKVQQCVYTVRSGNDPCLTLVYPAPDVAWRDIQILRDMRWGGF